MKFRYYITDTNNGIVSGTDDPDLAHDFSLSDDYFVVDSDTGEWLHANGGLEDILDIDYPGC